MVGLGNTPGRGSRDYDLKLMGMRLLRPYVHVATQKNLNSL